MHQELPYVNGHAARLSAREISQDELAQITVDIAATPISHLVETLRAAASRLQDSIDYDLLEFVT